MNETPSTGFCHMQPLAVGNTLLLADLADDVPLRLLLRSEWQPEAELVANWSSGAKEPGLVARGRSSCTFYLHHSITTKMAEAGLTGWTTWPLKIFGKNGQLYEDYAVLSVTGRCGKLLPEQSEIVPEDIGMTFPRHRGMFFDRDTWDGSDIFCPAGENTYIFSTSKVADAFVGCGVEGFAFPRIEEAIWYP